MYCSVSDDILCGQATIERKKAHFVSPQFELASPEYKLVGS